MAPSTARSRSWRPCTSEQTPILTRASLWPAPPQGWLVPAERRRAPRRPRCSLDSRDHHTWRSLPSATERRIESRVQRRVCRDHPHRRPQRPRAYIGARDHPAHVGRAGRPTARRRGDHHPPRRHHRHPGHPLLARARSPARSGWLSALHDPHIGRSLATIHRDPGHHWTLEMLAHEAAMSRSTFAARFTGRVGPARHDLSHPLEDEHRPHPPERGRSQCEPGRRRPRLQL